MDKAQVLADSHSAEAAQAAAVHQEATEKARAAQIEAAVARGNTQLIEAIEQLHKTSKPEWFALHEKDDDRRFTEQHDMIEKLMTRQDFEKMLRPAIIAILLKTGKGTKAAFITIAVIIASIGVIGGGIKVILSWIGFQLIK